MTGYYYLATPYSKYKTGINAAFLMACEIAARLISIGVPVFCPIAHSHPIALLGGLEPLSHDIWLPADKPLMDGAAAMIVYMADGWDESYGVKVEIEHFRKAGKQVFYLSPGAIAAEFLVQLQDPAAGRA
jgi:Domain of unknown function (DUF1937)